MVPAIVDQNTSDGELDPKEYLERIGYRGPLDGSLETLGRLQECHLYSVPYENLDILAGIPLSLEVEALFQKIVRQRRGGYCFELNALFGWLLKELGYSVTSLMARFWRDEPNPPPKRRHHVLKVELGDGFYLCDVGVGGIIPLKPVKIEDGLVQPQGRECYRITSDPDFGWMLWELVDGTWSKLYSFTDEPQLPKDFIMATFWCENAPDSIFTKSPMVAIRTREGRTTISGRELRIYTSNGVNIKMLSDEMAFHEALEEHFGIKLPF